MPTPGASSLATASAAPGPSSGSATVRTVGGAAIAPPAADVRPATGVLPHVHQLPLSAPRLALPRRGSTRPLPLPQSLPPLDVARFALGGSQEWLGFLTASLLGLPLAERAPTVALEAATTASPSNVTLAAATTATAASAAQPAIVSLSRDDSKSLFQPMLPLDNLPLLMLQTFALLFAIFTISTLLGNFQAGRQLWNARAMYESSPEQSIKPSGNSPLAVAAANQQLITYYNSQVLKERQQVLREALAEQPSHAAVARWEEQRWPRLPKQPAKMPPPMDRDWENIS